MYSVNPFTINQLQMPTQGVIAGVAFTKFFNNQFNSK